MPSYSFTEQELKTLKDVMLVFKKGSHSLDRATIDVTNKALQANVPFEISDKERHSLSQILETQVYLSNATENRFGYDMDTLEELLDKVKKT